jgi:hypothetical protein
MFSNAVLTPVCPRRFLTSRRIHTTIYLHICTPTRSLSISISTSTNPTLHTLTFRRAVALPRTIQIQHTTAVHQRALTLIHVEREGSETVPPACSHPDRKPLKMVIPEACSYDHA